MAHFGEQVGPKLNRFVSIFVCEDQPLRPRGGDSTGGRNFALIWFSLEVVQEGEQRVNVHSRLSEKSENIRKAPAPLTMAYKTLFTRTKNHLVNQTHWGGKTFWRNKQTQDLGTPIGFYNLASMCFLAF